MPELARLVVTPRRGGTLVDREGRVRTVVWTNTNRLLETEGYDGVKTGTTNAAGACLVGSGRRGDDRLIVVVLGSTSSEGRYVDARNLFRWGWLRLGQGSRPAQPRETSP
jgi:D-alanyl-D-alanine carboxypeptidase (penicillin-binding protein 5/6)